MTPDERHESFKFVDPESNMTFLETAKIWEKHDIVRILVKYGAEDVALSQGGSGPAGQAKDEEVKAQQPTMNKAVIDLIARAKEMMTNFGPIKMAYDLDPNSGFQCLKPVDLNDL